MFLEREIYSICRRWISGGGTAGSVSLDVSAGLGDKVMLM